MRLASLVGVAFFFISSVVSASTYTCDAVDRIAKLGYQGQAAVSIVTGNRECSFSIGGASVDGKQVDVNYQREEQDAVIFSSNQRDYFRHRFSDVLSRAIDAHGDSAEFIERGLPGSWQRFESVSCDYDARIVDIGRLRVGCKFVDSREGLIYLDGLTAIVSRAKHVISIAEHGGRTMYIFVNRTH